MLGELEELQRGDLPLILQLVSEDGHDVLSELHQPSSARCLVRKAFESWWQAGWVMRLLGHDTLCLR